MTKSTQFRGLPKVFRSEIHPLPYSSDNDVKSKDIFYLCRNHKRYEQESSMGYDAPTHRL